MRRSWAVFLVIELLGASAGQLEAETPPVAPERAGISRIALPFFKEHCLHCHGADEAKRDLRLEQRHHPRL